MKHQLLLLAGTLLAVSASAQTDISCAWNNLLDGPTTAGDQATDIAVNNAGDVYWLAVMGSQKDKNQIDYAGEPLFFGNNQYEGTSNNGNLTLLKTDSEGNKLWVVYSTSGDFANNVGGVAVTSDGGCVVASKVRHTDGFTDENLSLTDAAGTAVTVDWTCSQRYYRLMVNKVSAAGEIEWTRFVDCSTTPLTGEGFWSDCFNLGNVAVDNDDNIYLALNYRNTLSVPVADGDAHTFQPANCANWTGNSQTACGDFMLLKLDADGYYSNALTLEGNATAAYCQKVFFHHGKLYVQGYITGNGNTLSVQNHTLEPSEAVSPVILRAGTDLTIDWANCYKGAKVGNQGVIQNASINVVGNNLWLTAQYKLTLTDPANAANTITAGGEKTRDGLLLKLNATDGSWIAARSSDQDTFVPAVANSSIIGYLSTLQVNETADRIFVYGYAQNAAVGVFMRQYDATTLEAINISEANNIITGGSAPSAISCAYDRMQGCAYVTARGKGAFTTGNQTTAATATWAILTARLDLPQDMQTAISNVAADADNQSPVEYYDLQGRRVTNPAPGLYIRRQGTSATKVIL